MKLSELPCGIPSFGHSFAYVTPSVWVAIVLSVRKFLSIGTCCYQSLAMYTCISNLCEDTLPPDFAIGLFQINKDGDRIFVNLESILNFLCESNQLVFCGVITSEASLAWCDDIVVFEPPIQTFVDHPLYQCSDTLCQ